MKKILYIILCYNFYLFSFETIGRLDYWEIDHFLGFDKVGDCISVKGDISSVFSHIENNKLFFRVTFDDMFDRSVKADNFYNNEIGLKAFDNTTVDIENSNFINNVVYGLAIITEDPVVTVNYSNSWNNGDGDYWETCPG